jgi:acetolactate synthase-1/2/3 large subunit
MKTRVADYIAKFIEGLGVEDVFMLSGGGIMHLTDGLTCNKNLKVTCFHHEQAAAMAMDAYSRITGNFAVGYFTTGPGATNALTGVAGAWLDSVPCMFISAQAKRKQSVYNSGIKGLRQISVQEINIIPIVESITKYCAMVNVPEDIRYHLEKAVYYAKAGRPGPIWLDIPTDVQGAIIETDGLKGFRPKQTPPTTQDELYTKLTFLLKESKRPVILAGQGIRISMAINTLLSFAMIKNIPIVTTFLGVDIIDSTHPNYVGRVGIKGDRAGNLAVQNADVLIVIGSSLPVAETGYECDQFARKAKIVVVDICATTHDKNTVRIDLFFESDARNFINQLNRQCKENNIHYPPTWLNRCVAWREKYPVNLPEYKELKSLVNIYTFFDALCQYLTPKDIVVTDSGSAFFAGSQAIQIKQGMRYITSGGLATMGFALPASIGASIATNNQRVMCVTGEGGFQQNIQELQTVVHYNLPLKMFILNNEGYLSIRASQQRLFEGRLIGEGINSGVSFPDTEKIAFAYNIPYFRATTVEELKPMIIHTLLIKRPAICEIMCPPNQEIIPMSSSEKLENGTMVSKPLEDMYPFLPREEFNENMRCD